jgi:tetratricopeptide (TPR) repeat protein
MRQDIPAENRLRPFQSGRFQVYFQANRVFTPQDDLVLAFQVHGIDPVELELSEVGYTLFRDGEEIRNLSRSLSEYPDLPDITEAFPLQGLIPSHYRVRASLWTGGREILSQSQEFDITHADSLARPWIYSKLLAGIDHPDYTFVLGSQLYLSGQWKEARAFLEQAHQADPGSLAYSSFLARVYLAQEEYFLIPTILTPFLEDAQVLPFDFYYTLGRAYQRLGDQAQALEVLETARDHYGLNTWLLNVLGEIHYQQGQWAEARASWQRSLEIQPDQPAIRKLFDSLKEKK